MKNVCLFLVAALILQLRVSAQVNPALFYNTKTTFGKLDIRTTVSPTTYYYLKEGETFSFRESSPGVKTKTYRPSVTGWDTSPYEQGNMRYRNGSSDRFIMNYRLLKPLNYDQNFADGYPLIVFLHGGIERANCSFNSCYHSTWGFDPNLNAPKASTSPTHPLLNNDHQLKFGGKEHLEARNLAGERLPNDPTMPERAFSGFFLAPQMLNDWDTESVDHALRLILLHMKAYNIDPNRIYIHGLSVGGYAVFEALKRAPWLFAAAVPICAAKDGEIIDQKEYVKSINIPIWVFQGEKDVEPTVETTMGILTKWKAAGGNVRYTQYSDVGHSVWNIVYIEPDFFSWLMSKNKSDIHLYKGNSVIVDSKNIYPKLMLPHGFYAYQWEKDGVILSESAHEIEAREPGVYRARFRRTPNTVDDRWNRWSAPVRITTGSMPSGSDKIINDAKAYNGVPGKGKSEPVNLGVKESENHQSAHPSLKESAGL